MFIIRLVGTQELDSIQLLRAKVYEAEGLETPAAFTNGRLVDDDDDWAYHVAAFTVEGMVMAGAFKLTVRHLHSMRVEGIWAPEVLRVPGGGKAAELARLVVAPEYRTLGVSLGLWQAVYRLAISLGVEAAYAMQRTRTLDNEIRMGLPVTKLADPVDIHGHSYTPTVISVPSVISSIYNANPELAFFFSYDLPGGVFDAQAALRPPRRSFARFKALMDQGHHPTTPTYPHAA